MLKRVGVVVELLPQRNLAFRCSEEAFGSPRTGNFMGVLEAIAKIDLLLHQHIKRYGNKGKGHHHTCQKPFAMNLSSLRQRPSKIASLKKWNEQNIFNCGFDPRSLSLISRQWYYINGKVNGRFLGFLSFEFHTGLYLFDTVMSLLTTNGIPIYDCRGQAYGNARNMSGKYKGLQAQVKHLNENAVFVPCAGHSLSSFSAYSVHS